jgi:hypothetical protein
LTKILSTYALFPDSTPPAGGPFMLETVSSFSSGELQRVWGGRESFREDAAESGRAQSANHDLKERAPSRRRGTLLSHGNKKKVSGKNLFNQMARRGSQPASSPDLPEPVRKSNLKQSVRRGS